MTPTRERAGFTLIELVIVLTLVAILAALAMPRFIALQREARISKTQYVQGVIKSASVLARVRCEVDLHRGGPCTETGGHVFMEAAKVEMQNGYPAPTSTGIDVAAQIAPSEGIVASSDVSGVRVYDVTGGSTPGQCRVSYAGALPGAAPVMTLDVSGC